LRKITNGYYPKIVGGLCRRRRRGIMNSCKHEVSEENRKAIYYYYPSAAEAGFTKLQQNGINICIGEIPY